MNVLIVGGGNIVFGDLSKKIDQSKHFYWLCDLGFNIVGVVEPDATRASRIVKQLRLLVFSCLQDANKIKNSYDTVLIASPDETHEFYLRHFLKAKSIKTIICEKPLTTKKSFLEKAVFKSIDQKRVYLNLTRRFSLDHDCLSKMKDLDPNKVRSITVNYSKGILHNGIHAFDLIIPFLKDEFKAAKIEEFIDFRSDDPTISAVLWNEKIKVYLNGFDDKRYSIFELDVFCEDERFRFSRSGLELNKYRVEADDVYQGYFELMLVESKKTDLVDGLGNLYTDLKKQKYKLALNEFDVERLHRSHYLINLLKGLRVGEIKNVSW